MGDLSKERIAELLMFPHNIQVEEIRPLLDMASRSVSVETLRALFWRPLSEGRPCVVGNMSCGDEVLLLIARDLKQAAEALAEAPPNGPNCPRYVRGAQTMTQVERIALVRQWFLDALCNLRFWGDEVLPNPDDEQVGELLESLDAAQGLERVAGFRDAIARVRAGLYRDIAMPLDVFRECDKMLNELLAEQEHPREDSNL